MRVVRGAPNAPLLTPVIDAIRVSVGSESVSLMIGTPMNARS